MDLELYFNEATFGENRFYMRLGLVDCRGMGREITCVYMLSNDEFIWESNMNEVEELRVILAEAERLVREKSSQWVLYKMVDEVGTRIATVVKECSLPEEFYTVRSSCL